MGPSSPIRDLAKLLASMEPVLNEGTYVFTTLESADAIPRSKSICEFKEVEGITLVLRKEDALEYRLPFEYEAAWITLNVHSALEAVGLTAAFASALGQHNISCNVIAGYYHDHIFVDYHNRLEAMSVLLDLAKSSKAQ